VTLNLKSPRGREIFFRLAEHCDVVIENMSEGKADSLGVGYEQTRRANPRIIYASITAFGDPSVHPGLKGMDILVQALSGLLEVTGFSDGPPTRVGIPVADLVTPLFTVNGILAALIQRGRTSEGQRVTVSMLDCLASLVAEEHFDVFYQRDAVPRSGNSLDRLAPFGVYPCRDGHVAIVAFQTEWLKGLLEAMGCPELVNDPRFSSRGPRTQHAAALNGVIEAWTRTRRADEVVHELFERRGLLAARVRSPLEVLHDPRLQERGAVVKLEHPVIGQVQAFGMGNPIHFANAHAQFDEPAQELGAANEQILRGLLNYSASELDELRAAGVI
jgi:crotonobetainyl-CoA:carnitine CoA-transferase CaiB-like acyl-CoA transferase